MRKYIPDYDLLHIRYNYGMLLTKYVIMKKFFTYFNRAV